MAWGIQWSVATVLILGCMGAAGYYVFMYALEGGSHVQVPAITGVSITDASRLLMEQGLEMGKQTQVPDPSTPAYHVLAQYPPAGRVVRTGRRVNTTVSLGAAFLSAPNLVGQPWKDAVWAVNQAGFTEGAVARVRHREPRDTVIAQDPPAGREIPNQGQVHLLLSAGSEQTPTFMPDILGMDIEQLRRELAPFGVVPEAIEVNIPGARSDVVLRQEPAPDSVIYEGQKVYYEYMPSDAASAKTGTRYTAKVRHTMPYQWHDRDVRVDLVDRNGNRETAFTKAPAYDEAARARYLPGTAIALQVQYVEEASLEVFIDGSRVTTYSLRRGAEPTSQP